jgi:hypothetical protein
VILCKGLVNNLYSGLESGDMLNNKMPKSFIINNTRSQVNADYDRICLDLGMVLVGNIDGDQCNQHDFVNCQ